eukprot:TRINITY_DN11229_c0_g1_i1.p1 TRINITY_DN11229_c0_g1~~TRINITY_DN11229_c0_g1_i1.p1  ORF type:complete len:241 (+),score=14.52 TRINITY_DN11229_c0_g1_i1:33-755(+)
MVYRYTRFIFTTALFEWFISLGVTAAWQGNNEAFGRVELLGSDQDNVGWLFHPAALDSCIHLCELACSSDGLYLPAGASRVWLSRHPVNDPIWCFVERTNHVSETAHCNVTLYNVNGTVIGFMNQLTLKRTSKFAFLRQLQTSQEATSDVPSDDLFEVIWEGNPAFQKAPESHRIVLVHNDEEARPFDVRNGAHVAAVRMADVKDALKRVVEECSATMVLLFLGEAVHAPRERFRHASIC